MDTSRLLLAILLSLGLVFAYQELVLKRFYPPPKPGEPAPNATASGPMTAANGNPAATAAPVVPVVMPPIADALPPASHAAEKLIEVDTTLYHATFTTHGGRLKSLRLKQYRQMASADSPPYEMVWATGTDELPLGVILDENGKPADDRDLDYATNMPDRIELSDSRQGTIALSAKTADGTIIEKNFSFTGDKYAFGMQVSVNAPKPPASIALAMMAPLTERGEGYYDIPALQADVADKVLNENEKSLKKGVAPVSGQLRFVGFGDRYFLNSFMPESPAVGTLSMEFLGTEASARLIFPGASSITTRVYMGPKKLEALEAVSPTLTKSINFGWSSILALPFLRILKIFHMFVPNWGWDIILMTLALRILMLPMSIRGQRSMIRMQRLQPQMERLRAQFKDDSERLNKEMVDLYKRNHVNPVGGCAPMIIQLPVFIGLYEALLNAVDLRHAPFMLWMKDLSAPDCFPIAGFPKLPIMHCQGIPVLVLLMGVSAYFQQAMTPTQPDPNQQRMMMLSPIIFTIFFVNFPAGLSLYYFASNVLGVIQQFVLNREFKQAAPAS
ncbi:MAG TPA: membrane protein insertase YidC [Candidatus Binataceae bacterium]|nr:membrane protein insertase YidC [Candidatus Binataceae bacterium]